MSPRLERTWSVRTSYQTDEGSRCVDVFVRPDATFGFEEFRRDPEDLGVWTATGSFSGRVFACEQVALAAARRAVPWLGPLLER